ncbi:hypothetical protein [Microcoleus sp. Pol12B5]
MIKFCLAIRRQRLKKLALFVSPIAELTPPTLLTPRWHARYGKIIYL